MSETQVCNRKHHRWLVRRLAYKGLGNYETVYFRVWTHSTDFDQVQNDTICRRTRQGFVPVGTMDECFVEPVRSICRR